jgi:hypothetical protein
LARAGILVFLKIALVQYWYSTEYFAGVFSLLSLDTFNVRPRWIDLDSIPTFSPISLLLFYSKFLHEKNDCH